MGEKGNILLCLEGMNIGGVETFVINQALALKQQKYKVFVIAKEGLYVEKLNKEGISFIDYEFKMTNYYDTEQIEDIVKILQDNKITEVHINQFIPIINVAIACILANVPYVVYLHFSSILINTKDDPLDWFEGQCFTYRENVEFVLSYAYKIIAISDKVKEYILNRYPKLSKDKVLVLPNSIDFKKFSTNQMVKCIKKYLLITRFSKEKEPSIKKAIEFFEKYKDKNPDAELTIVGDGEIYQEFYEKYKEEMNFIGATSNVKLYIEQADLVMGLGRCIIESIAMKRIALISTYTEKVGLVTKDNIEDVMQNNFAGGNFDDLDDEKLVKRITDLKSSDIESIVNDNYSFIKSRLDIDKNLYVTNLKEWDYKVDKEIIRYMIKTNCMLGKSLDSTKEKMENDWKEHLKYVKYAEDKIASTKRSTLKEKIKKVLKNKKRN